MKKKNCDCDVRERILIAARELFIKNGYNGTNIRDIVTMADTNIALVNYYFGSKYQLFEIVFEEAFDQLTSRIFSILRSDIPFFDMIEKWIATYYDFLIDNPQIPIFILNEINKNPKKLAERIGNKKPYRVVTLLTNRINEESQKGSIRPTDPLDLMLNIMSLCVAPFIFNTIIVQVSDMSQESFNQMLVNHKDYAVKFVFAAIKK